MNILKIASILCLLLIDMVACASKSCQNFFPPSLVGLQLTSADGKYSFGLCSDAPTSDKSVVTGAGVLDLDAAKPIVLGKWSDFYATGGRYWTEIVYMSGRQVSFGSVNCSTSAHVMLICDEAAPSAGSFRYVGNVSQPDSGQCYLVFELLHRRFCSLVDKSGGLPAVAIVLIVLLSLFCAYLLIGAAIQRAVYKRSGLEMIPNYSIWRKCGDSMADGCDFVCRSGGGDGGQQQSQRRYQPVSGGRDDEDDENLLPA